MRIIKVLLLLFAFGVVNICNAYRILGLYPFTGKSHFIMINQLFKGLARKGHQVDVITAFPEIEKYPNYTQIFTFPDVTSELQKKMTYESLIEFTRHRNISVVAELGYRMCENMGTPEFLKLARNPPKDPPYDIVIMQMFNYHCFTVLGHLWDVPVALISTAALYPWMHDMIGNPENIAFSPNNLAPIPDGNGLWTRIYNTLIFYFIKFIYLYFTTRQDVILQKHFGPDVPSIRELEQTASLVLMNTYFPVNGAKPMATGVIEVGGLHIQNDGPDMDDNLKKWLDEGKEGVVYFTLGSVLRIEIFPAETLKAIFEPLEKLSPTRVLIRISEPEELAIKLPGNFKSLPWIPQEKVLQHPNVKLFITHGGLLGTQESIYYGVPMLCLPVLADQYTNTQNYVQQKIAVSANIMAITRENFEKALNEVLTNPVYRENVKRLSKVFRDRPQSAIDTATFWIEYVIRNGKDSLRSSAMDLAWWQLALLDVFLITTISLSAVIFVIIFIIRQILKCLFFKKVSTVADLKKKID